MNETLNESSLLNLNFYVKCEIMYGGKYPMAEESKELKDQIKFHHKALFDAFNEALDMERPYKDKGQPMPWSKQTRIVKKAITQEDVDRMIVKAKERVISWCKTGAGTRLAPLPATKSSDDSHPMHIPSEEDRRHRLREERMGVLIVLAQ